jgi:hypothetical protein
MGQGLQWMEGFLHLKTRRSGVIQRTGRVSKKRTNGEFCIQ